MLLPHRYPCLQPVRQMPRDRDRVHQPHRVQRVQQQPRRTRTAHTIAYYLLPPQQLTTHHVHQHRAKPLRRHIPQRVQQPTRPIVRLPKVRHSRVHDRRVRQHRQHSLPPQLLHLPHRYSSPHINLKHPMLPPHKVRYDQHRIAPVPVHPKLLEISVIVRCKIGPHRLVRILRPQHIAAVLRLHRATCQQHTQEKAHAPHHRSTSDSETSLLQIYNTRVHPPSTYSYDVHRSLHNNRVPPYHPSLDHPKDVHPSHAPTHRHHHLPLRRYTTVENLLEAPMDVV